VTDMTDRSGDKRRHPRLMREETLSIRPVSGGQGIAERDAIYCSTVDMSASGIQVQLERPLPEGQHLDIWIALLDDLGTYHLQGKVNWVREESSVLVAGIEIMPHSEDIRGWEELFS